MAERDRDTVVVTDTGGDRGGSGAVLAVVLLLVIALVLFLIFGTNLLDGLGGGGTDTIKADININPGGSGK